MSFNNGGERRHRESAGAVHAIPYRRTKAAQEPACGHGRAGLGSRFRQNGGLRHPHSARRQCTAFRCAARQAAFFRATHQGAGLDLPMLEGARRAGVEFKRADSPQATQRPGSQPSNVSVSTSLEDCGL